MNSNMKINNDNDNTKNNNDNINNDISIWVNNPAILLDTTYLFEVWPIESMSREQKINAISRLVFYLTIIGVFLFRSVKILVTGVVTLALLIITYYALIRRSDGLLKKKLKESFSNDALYQKFKHNYTNPTTQNPTMNVLLPEINDNPQRLQAAPAYNKAVEKQINESTQNIIKKNFDDETIDKKLFKDLGDKFQFEQSMRQFYSTPNTLVPNNQKDFAQFCYGNMASCKDGDVEMCLKSTANHRNI